MARVAFLLLVAAAAIVLVLPAAGATQPDLCVVKPKLTDCPFKMKP